MIDIKYIRENPEEAIKRLSMKGRDVSAEISEMLELDKKRRAMIAETDRLKAEQNRTSKLVAQYKKASGAN